MAEPAPNRGRARRSSRPATTADGDGIRRNLGQRQVLSREGEYWRIEYAGQICRLHDSVGMRYLAHLLEHPGEVVASVDLQEHRPRMAGRVCVTAAAERARVGVTRAIRAAIERIARYHADLAEHLRAHIRTGTSCSYRRVEPPPDPAIANPDAE